jgi:hypothetical protein
MEIPQSKSQSKADLIWLGISFCFRSTRERSCRAGAYRLFWYCESSIKNATCWDNG